MQRPNLVQWITCGDETAKNDETVWQTNSNQQIYFRRFLGRRGWNNFRTRQVQQIQKQANLFGGKRLTEG